MRETLDLWKRDDNVLKVSHEDLISQEIMENLLLAHARIAQSGKVSDLIQLTKYLLSVSKKPVFAKREFVCGMDLVDDEIITTNQKILSVEGLSKIHQNRK